MSLLGYRQARWSQHILLLGFQFVCLNMYKQYSHMPFLLFAPWSERSSVCNAHVPLHSILCFLVMSMLYVIVVSEGEA